MTAPAKTSVMLPVATTVHARVIAPVEQRVAYMSQWLRLTEPEAVAEVQGRDRQRIEFLSAFADGDPNDPTAYDLVLNSDRLGVEACADLIAQAVRIKQLPEASAPENNGWDLVP